MSSDCATNAQSEQERKNWEAPCFHFDILRNYFRVVEPKCCVACVFITSYVAQVGLILEGLSAAFHSNIIFDILSWRREEEVAQKTLSLPDKEWS